MGSFLTGRSSWRPALDYSRYDLTCPEWCKYFAFALGTEALLSYIFYKSFFLFLIFIPLCAVFPFFKKKDLLVTRKRTLTLEFKEAILILSSLLSAGYSLENALKEAVNELKLLYQKNSLIIRELEYINHLIFMNISVEKAFDDLAKRSGVEDIKGFARVLRIAKRSGGELEEIISHSAAVIGDKVRIKEEILTLTAAKRFEQKVMNAFPILIVLYIDLSSPGFFTAMYTTWIGRIFMTVCMGAYLFAIYISRKLLRVEV